MPEIVCDTAPLQRLHRGNALDVLKSLYDRVLVPESVKEEIDEGREEGLDLPDLDELEWIEVVSPGDPEMVSENTGIGVAEREVMALAMETAGAVIVMDDPLGRRHAKLMRQPATGTIGILLRAKSRKLITSIGTILERLDGRGFRMPADTKANILAWAGETM